MPHAEPKRIPLIPILFIVAALAAGWFGITRWLDYQRYETDARKVIRTLRNLDSQTLADSSGARFLPLLEASRKEVEGFLQRYDGRSGSVPDIRSAWTGLEAVGQLTPVMGSTGDPIIRARYATQRNIVYQRSHAALLRAEHAL